MIKNIKLLCLSVLITGLSLPAHGFVAQSPEMAISYRNVARDGAYRVSEAAPGIYYNAEPSVPVDNNAIARQILPERPEQIVRLNLNTADFSNVLIPINYTLRLSLPEAENTSWHIDTNENIIRPHASSKEDSTRVLEFQAASLGTTKIFLDNHDNDSRCLQSRIIRIKVVE